jgi:ABC-type nitrate/sulfonate/bicarbonate transport system permease component
MTEEAANAVVDTVANVADTVAETVSNATEAVKPSNIATNAGIFVAKKAITSKPSIRGAGIGGVIGAVLGGAVGYLFVNYRRRKQAKEKHYHKPAPGSTEGVKEVATETGIQVGTSISIAVIAAAIGSLIGIYFAYGRPLLKGYQAVTDTVDTVKDVAGVVTDTVDTATEVLLGSS